MRWWIPFLLLLGIGGASAGEGWMVAQGRRGPLRAVDGAYVVTWAPGVESSAADPAAPDGPDRLDAGGATLRRVGRLGPARYHTERYDGDGDPTAVLRALRALPDVAAASRLLALEGNSDAGWRAPTDRLLVRTRDDGRWLQEDPRLLGPRGGAPRQLVLRLGRGEDAVEAAMALALDPRVEWAQPDWLEPRAPRWVPQDDRFAEQWHLDNAGQGGGVVGADLGATGAWDVTLGEGVVVAVLDSGLDGDHPEFPDALPGWDFIEGDADVDPGGSSAHGTRVAGVAAARADGVGVVGACPMCRVLPVRMLGVSSEGEADAIDFAVDAGADVMNNSWGPPDGTGDSYPMPPVVQTAVERAVEQGRDGLGVVIFWASGNGNPLESCALDGYVSHPSTIGVGASTNLGQVSSFSERCPGVDLSSPSAGGTRDITTTHFWLPSDPTTGYTSSFGGTSAAAPGATGVGALVVAAHPGFRWQEVRTLLRMTAERVDPDADWDAGGHSDAWGYGRVDADAALHADPVFLTAEPPVAPCGASIAVRLALPGLPGQGQVDADRDGVPLTLWEQDPGVYEGGFDLVGASHDDVATVRYGLATAEVHVDCLPPVVTDAAIGAVGPWSAELVWRTDEPSFGQTIWGAGTAERIDTALGAEHHPWLSQLRGCQTYAVELVARDVAGNETRAPDALTVTTAPDPILTPTELPDGADPCDPTTWGDDDDSAADDDDDSAVPVACDCQRGCSALLLLAPWPLRLRRRR